MLLRTYCVGLTADLCVADSIYVCPVRVQACQALVP